MNSDAIRAYTDRATSAFNNRDVSALLELQVEDFVYWDPNGEQRGRDRTAERELAIFEAFPDIQVEMHPFALTETTLAVQTVLRGTHKGDFILGDQIAKASGNPVEIHFAAHFTFADGLAASERVYYDRLELAMQLGLMG